MTPNQSDLQFVAECSCRYHQRRCAFFDRADKYISWLSLLMSVGGTVFLLGGETGLIVKVVGALTSILVATQLFGRPAELAHQHSKLFAKWQDYLVNLQTHSNASQPMMQRFLKTRGELESQHTGQLNALVNDCRNRAILALELDPSEIRKIAWWQRPLLHFADLQSEFPKRS